LPCILFRFSGRVICSDKFDRHHTLTSLRDRCHEAQAATSVPAPVHEHCTFRYGAVWGIQVPAKKKVHIKKNTDSMALFFIFVVPCIVITGLRNLTRCNSMQIFIYCQIALHVSGVNRVHHQSLFGHV